MKRIRNIALVALILLILGFAAGALGLSASYRERIYPGVTVAGEELGGLTQAEAARRVSAALPDPETQSITVQLADQAWHLSWSMVGRSYDADTALAEAYAVGRDRPWWLGFLSLMRTETVVIPVPQTPADPARVGAYVEKIAERVALAPVNATLTIERGEVVTTPAQEGRRLDVEAGTQALLEALQAGSETVTLEPEAIPPQRATAEPAASEAGALLAQPHRLIVEDPLTGDIEAGGYYTEFVALPDRIGTWFNVTTTDEGFALERRSEAMRAWLNDVAPQIGEERVVEIEATHQRLIESLDAGRYETRAQISHPPQTYTVKAGDVFYDIAYNFGFPQWQLEQANPDVDPGLIDIGQVLTIPSIDVLFPHPLVDGKRIEIDLPTQTLRAYEEDEVFMELKISSGISTTPTIAGQFQILFKEEEAYARRWSLDMPYFMAFYEEGEEFYNGIHELPITSYGLQLSPYVLGWPASYGCIIVGENDAEALYRWADIGTLVRVKGVAPGTPFGQQTLSDIAPLTSEEETP